MKTLAELGDWLDEAKAKLALAYAKGEWIAMLTTQEESPPVFGHAPALEDAVNDAIGKWRGGDK